jgi:hypothetical protein
MRSATVSMDLTWASTPGVGRESRQRTRNYEDANIITGATGNQGSATARHLLADG